MKIISFLFFVLLILPIQITAQVTQEWVSIYNGPTSSNDDAYSMAVDNEGNVYVIGFSQNGADFQQHNYTTIKFNSSGVAQWTATYNGPGNSYDRVRSIAIDNEGNVYVTGESEDGSGVLDYATVKYNSSGVEQWVKRYNGPGNSDDQAYSIAIDDEGNVYVTGLSRGGTATGYDYATIKYNSSGVEQWVKRYSGPGNGDGAFSLAVDGSGNVYVTGLSASEIGDDYATIKYNSSGVEQWVARYNGPANSDDRANSIAIDNEGNVYVTGRSWGGQEHLGTTPQ